MDRVGAKEARTEIAMIKYHGATVMLSCLEAGKDVVSVNAEVDAAIGHFLHHVAKERSAVYTISDGDQPGGLLRQIELAEGMGFEVVAAVNCKRHLDVRQTPATSAPYAERDGTSPAVTTSAGDGTKMQIECAVVANVAELPPDRRGMHGVPTTLERALHDVLAAVSRRGVVEYTLGGDFGAGVFVIARAPEHDLVQRPLRFFKMGDGPDYLFFRPYTLVQFEMPITIADVVLDREALGVPSGPPVAEVVAVAKRDLVAGEALDGIGGFTCYGQIDTVDGAAGLLPIALAHHARLRDPVRQDHPVSMDAVELDEEAAIVTLRRRQDRLLGLAPVGA
jgi:predicted homoserine dehydrogenase-like protein